MVFGVLMVAVPCLDLGTSSRRLQKDENLCDEVELFFAVAVSTDISSSARASSGEEGSGLLDS